MSGFAFLLVDLGIVATLALSAVLAASRGFVKEILAVGAWIAAAVAAWLLFPSVKDFTRDLVASDRVADGITIGVIFLVTLAVVFLISQPISARVRESNMGTADRALGFGFGLVRGVLIVAIGYLVVTWFTPERNDQPDWLREAKLMPVVEQVGDWLLELVPAAFRGDGLLAVMSAATPMGTPNRGWG